MRAPVAGPGVSGRPVRRVGVLLAALVLLLVLTGCVQVRQDLRVDADGTVSGSLRWGVDRRLLETGGAGDPELARASFDAGPDADGVTVSTFADDGYAGQEITFDAVPLAAFEPGAGDLDLRLTPDGFWLRMRSPAERIDALAVAEVPLTPTGSAGADGRAAVAGRRRSGAVEAASVTGSAVVEGPGAGVGRSGEVATDLVADVHLAVTFPGRVQRHNGTEVRGSTVIWRYRSLAELDAAPAWLEAVWDDSGLLAGSHGGDGPSWRLAGPVGAVLAAGSCVAAALVVRRRRAVRARGGRQRSGPARAERAAW